MTKRTFAESCDTAVAAQSGEDSILSKAGTEAPPWCYFRVVRLTERHVTEFALPDTALHAFAVAKLPDDSVIGEWLDSCGQGDMSWLPWAALVFEADSAEGEYYAVSDPDEHHAGRFDLELADARLPMITRELTALYVTVVAEFVGKAMLMDDGQRLPIIEKYENHWGYEAVRDAVKAMHAGGKTTTHIVVEHNVESKLLEAWKNKLAQCERRAADVAAAVAAEQKVWMQTR